MIKLKTEKDIEKLRISGKILSKLLNELSSYAREGLVLSKLDEYANNFLRNASAKSAFLGFQPDGSEKPYPASICTSVNEQIVHGIPGDYELKNGDILSIDIGVDYKGYITDAAVTIGIGDISKKAKQLILYTKKALGEAIKVSLKNNHIGDIGYVIEKTAKDNDLKVIRGLTGHGVGFELHEDPAVYNFGKKGDGILLKPGLVIAIEPMFSLGSANIFQADDESYVTRDGSLCAHFEHTIVITENGPEVLTKF